LHICDINKSGVSFGLRDRCLELLCNAALYAGKTELDTPERIQEVLTSCFITSSFRQRDYDRIKLAQLLKVLDMQPEDVALLRDCDPELEKVYQQEIHRKEDKSMNKYDNIRIFEDTMQVIKTSETYRNLTEKAKESTKLYEKAVIFSPGFEQPVKISVTKERTIECALRLLNEQNERVAVLNFASPKNPGGGVRTGASAQEEAICRITNLYPCLTKIDGKGIFYDARVKSPYTDKTLYTRDVAVIKTDEIEPVLLKPNIDDNNPKSPCDVRRPVCVDVVTCAAPNQSGITIPDDELYAIIRRRLAIVLSACVENGAEIVVLGAWGCGAFRNPPDTVAKAMIDEIRENFNFAFRQIVFAVYCPGTNQENYEVFKKIIG